MKKTELVCGLIFMFAGMFFITVMLNIYFDNMGFFKEAEKTTAVITDIEKNPYKKTDYNVYISYEIDGVKYENVNLGYYTSSMNKGDEITVHYDPEKPYDARSMGGDVFETYIGTFVGIGIGLLFVAIGGANVYSYVRKKTIKGKGKRFEEDIINVEVQQNVKVNGRHPIIVTCQLVNPYTGIMETYRSERVYKDPWEYGLSKVPVYINEKKPSIYMVDVDEAIEAAMSYGVNQQYR